MKDTTPSNRFGELIRTRRIILGYTQRQLGEMCGYEGRQAETYVQKWEYDQRPVPIDHLRRLAKALELPLEALIP
jgi:transcriptional regulator with XRE-family HTH domain